MQEQAILPCVTATTPLPGRLRVGLVSLVLACGGCGKTTAPVNDDPQALLSASACRSEPPRPIKNDWNIAGCRWYDVARTDYMSPWITAATGLGGEYPPPVVKVAWIAVYGKRATGEIETLYYTPSGQHGLDTKGQWASRWDPDKWFQDPIEDLVIGPPSEVVTIVMDRPYGRDIAHAWNAWKDGAGHIRVPAGIDNVWVEAKVQLQGDVRLQVGFDWYRAPSGGKEVQEGEGATSHFIGGLSCTDWVIISSPRKDDPSSPKSCDPVMNVPGVPPPTTWTFDFTVSRTPVSDLKVYRKGSAGGELPVTQNGANQYRITTPSFLSSDTLVITWFSGGTQHWGCQNVEGKLTILTPLTATSPDGQTYNGYIVSNGLGGCDIGLQ